MILENEHSLIRLEGRIFVSAELMRRRLQITDDEMKQLAGGMLVGICEVLEARFGRDGAKEIVLALVLSDGLVAVLGDGLTPGFFGEAGGGRAP